MSAKNTTYEFAVISDKKYLKHLKSLLISLKYNNYKCQVNICLVNIDNNQRLKSDLMKLYEFIEIIFIKQKFTSDLDRRSFCANYRVTFLNDLIKRNIKLLIYIDVDSIFINPDPGFSEFIEDCDIKILMRNEIDRRFKVATGVIFLKNSSLVHLFLKTWLAKIHKIGNTWFADQISFSEAAEDLKQEVSIKSLDKKYIDWEFYKDSVIWTGKGNRKTRNFKYISKVIYFNIWYRLSRASK